MQGCKHHPFSNQRTLKFHLKSQLASKSIPIRHSHMEAIEEGKLKVLFCTKKINKRKRVAKAQVLHLVHEQKMLREYDGA
jgi:hypothetical protein